MRYLELHIPHPSTQRSRFAVGAFSDMTDLGDLLGETTLDHVCFESAIAVFPAGACATFGCIDREIGNIKLGFHFSNTEFRKIEKLAIPGVWLIFPASENLISPSPSITHEAMTEDRSKSREQASPTTIVSNKNRGDRIIVT